MRKKLVVLSCGLFLLLAVAVVGDWQPTRGADVTTHIHLGPADRQAQSVPGGRDVVWDNGMLYDGLGASQYDDVNALDPILADDFMFTIDQDVNDVHWIGGYWNGPPDDGDFDWEIKFYNDDGTGNAPGAEIITYTYANSDVNETWIDGVPGGSNFYSYSVTLSTSLTFTSGTKYWISIQGIGVYPPQSGWAYHQDPIVLHEAVFKSVYFGYPDWTNTSTVFGYAVDMCFQLTFEEGCTWNIDDPHKMHYPQLPDEDGWDVNATYPITLADDFLCTDSGYIEDIHFWGSWKNDSVGEILYFMLSIHDNIPQGPGGYSIPGNLRWQFEVPFEWVTTVPIDPPTPEGWYDPSIPEEIPDDHWSYFQYNICLYDWIDTSQMFYQLKDTIYWLDISAVVLDPAIYQWGWKNTEDHWLDDAVWMTPGGPGWQEIYEPGGPAGPITNDFWVNLDAEGIPVPDSTGGTDYYDDGTSLNGWYYYPNTGWWNIWFYDHPFDPTRYKDIFIEFTWEPTDSYYWIEVAINWSTDSVPPGFPPPIPPLTPDEEDLYVGREYIPVLEPGPVSYQFTIPDYNPEWVSVDIMGQNVSVFGGQITHECLPQDSVSLDLSFVITGGPCSPSIEVEKTVFDEPSGAWTDFTEEDVGGEVEFQIVAHNNGTCCELTDVTIIDTLDDSFEFVGATPWPDEFNGIPGVGMEMIWYYTGVLPVCNSLYFYVQATVLGPACHHDTNRVWVEGFCEATGEYVNAADFASVHATQPDLDFGDVPDPTYPTLLASDGARHVIVPGIHLGNLIDAEANGQPSVTALRDDNAGVDDEDGIVFTSLVVQGQPGSIRVYASVAGFVDGWIDWNADGDWDEANEHMFIVEPVVAGPNNYLYVTPADAAIGVTYARFRFTTAAGGLPWDGLAPDGEVEDYRVFILEPIEHIKMHWPQWPDMDRTGMDVKFPEPLQTLADDFMCMKTALITDIHIWGSFKGDNIPPGGPGDMSFLLQLWSNQPAVPPYNHSQPKDLLWSHAFPPGTYSATQVSDNNPEDWYDPATEMWLNDNHFRAFQYDFFIDADSAYKQDSSTIYWLSVTLTSDEYIDTIFGWKTTEFEHRWEDDAVWMPPTGGWLPMTYPPDYIPTEYAGTTLDLAFAITGKCKCGDVDASGGVDIDDIVYLIAFIFQGGPPPVQYAAGDVNCDGVVDIDDATYLIAYIFMGGPPPCDPDNDGIPDC